MPTRNDRQLLLQIIDCAFDKPSWHGPNLRNSIRGISAERAAKSIRGRKSIRQHVRHAAYWKQRVANKLGAVAKMPWRGTNWPRITDGSEAAWKRDIAALEEIHRRLRDAVIAARRLTDKDFRRICGVAAHDVYHAGQVQLLRKLSVKT